MEETKGCAVAHSITEMYSSKAPLPFYGLVELSITCWIPYSSPTSRAVVTNVMMDKSGLDLA